MAIETVRTCPLGSKCEEIKDNKLYRCVLYHTLPGQDRLTGEPVEEWNCALVWQNILSIENSMTNRSIAAATESFRNEVVTGTALTNNILMNAAAAATLELTHGFK